MWVKVRLWYFGIDGTMLKKLKYICQGPKGKSGKVPIGHGNFCCCCIKVGQGLPDSEGLGDASKCEKHLLSAPHDSQGLKALVGNAQVCSWGQGSIASVGQKGNKTMAAERCLGPVWRATRKGYCV